MTRIRTHTNPLHIVQRLKPMNWDIVFSKNMNQFDLEIGFGRGVFFSHYSQKYPFRQLIGVDVRKKVVNLMQENIKRNKIHNGYVIYSTAQIMLEDVIPDKSLERVFIFHPDPWFKKRHYKRRVITPELLALLEKKCMPKSKLYISTDVKILWKSINELIKRNAAFRNITDTNDNFWETDYLSHWQDFSQRDQRSQYVGTYELSIA